MDSNQFLNRLSGAKEGLTYGYDGLVMENVGLAAFEEYITPRYPELEICQQRLCMGSRLFCVY